MTTRENKSNKKDSRGWPQMNADTRIKMKNQRQSAQISGKKLSQKQKKMTAKKKKPPKKSAPISENQRQKNKTIANPQQKIKPQINADERRYENKNEKSAQISVNQRQENKTTTPNPRQKKEEPKILRIERIFSGYKKREVLKGISLEINKGEVVAVIGKNGAGKSTLLKAIMGFLPVWDGNIYLDEERITNKPPYIIQNKGIGYLMQGGRIFPHLTIQENLEVAGNRLTKNLIKNRIKEMYEILPFLKNRSLHAQAGSLSGGERHQLSLGMVLMNDLDLLLLDEPSAGLSPANVDKMYEILEEVKNQRHQSILLIEQKVTEAVKFSERVCLLKNGKINRQERSQTLESIDDIGFFFFGGLKKNDMA